MEQSGTWDSTTVIVTADHGWRETQIVGRKHDGRVPLLIKVAGQDQHRQYDGTFSILVLKDLTLDFLRGQINSNQEIETRLES